MFDMNQQRALEGQLSPGLHQWRSGQQVEGEDYDICVCIYMFSERLPSKFFSQNFRPFPLGVSLKQ